MDPVKVGIIGCGDISDVYFEAGKKFEAIEIVACSDLVKSRYTGKAKEHGVPKPCTVKQLLADKTVEIVLNLTVPQAHAKIAMDALKAGKNTYCEKPLALTREEGQEILALANKNGLLVGSAPDTFMGAGIQTARKLIDDGWIGEPVSATAFMQCHGHESWHPNPVFFYQPGGGPLFDMGPYYLTALVNLLGPVRRVCGATRVTFPERTITNEEQYGEKIEVEVPTHVAGVMDFDSGAIGTMITSFDVWAATLPPIEVHGTSGSLRVPDPNGFGGAVKVQRAGAEAWSEVPHSHPYAENSRGIGVADMAYALRTGREHRASGNMAYHVLDVMHAFHDSSDKGQHVLIKSKCKRPESVPMDVREGVLDE